jgi:hypothetical protein
VRGAFQRRYLDDLTASAELLESGATSQLRSRANRRGRNRDVGPAGRDTPAVTWNGRDPAREWGTIFGALASYQRNLLILKANPPENNLNRPQNKLV